MNYYRIFPVLPIVRIGKERDRHDALSTIRAVQSVEVE